MTFKLVKRKRHSFKCKRKDRFRPGYIYNEAGYTASQVACEWAEAVTEMITLGKSGEPKKLNKAGYTATSCGRVGRGGKARFHTFRLVVTDARMDRRTDKGSYRVACPQQKVKAQNAMETTG